MGTFYSGSMPAALAPEGIETVGACYRGQLKSWAHFTAGLCLQPWQEDELKSWAHLQSGFRIVGTSYSGTMPAALAPERIEIVGAFCRGQLKSWAHFIAGLCLQPWPQKELKSWAHFTLGI